MPGNQKGEDVEGCGPKVKIIQIDMGCMHLVRFSINRKICVWMKVNSELWDRLAK